MQKTFNVKLIILFILMTQFVNAQFRDNLFSPSLEEMSEKMSQIDANNLPKTELLLYEEKNRTQSELEKYSGFIKSLETKLEKNDKYDKIKNKIDSIIGSINTLDCNETDLKAYKKIKTEISNMERENRFDMFDMPSFYTDSSFKESVTQKELCSDMKNNVADTKTGFDQFFESRQAEFTKNQTEYTPIKAKAEDVAKKLREYLDKINNEIAKKDPQQAISNSLWLIILAVGGMSLATIFCLKFFDKELQIEWVVSGQVIQFVTVMILLSVIMVLGLSNILKENTLGTLLGGIAGYVLSQGVGRAAAREVSKLEKKNADG
jgi:hypothetical protein